MKISRLIFLLIVIICTGLLGFGLYLEHMQGLEPCPLCVLQRIAYVVIAIVALAGAIHGTEKLMKYIYAGLIIVASLAGAGIAGRQVWLQYLPPEKVPECGPGYEYLMEVFPLDEALGMIFTGSGECAEVDWTFIGFSIAEWSLLMFILLCSASFYAVFTKNNYEPLRKSELSLH